MNSPRSGADQHCAWRWQHHPHEWDGHVCKGEEVPAAWLTPARRGALLPDGDPRLGKSEREILWHDTAVEEWMNGDWDARSEDKLWGVVWRLMDVVDGERDAVLSLCTGQRLAIDGVPCVVTSVAIDGITTRPVTEAD